MNKGKLYQKSYSRNPTMIVLLIAVLLGNRVLTRNGYDTGSKYRTNSELV